MIGANPFDYTASGERGTETRSTDSWELPGDPAGFMWKVVQAPFHVRSLDTGLDLC